MNKFGCVGGNGLKFVVWALWGAPFEPAQVWFGSDDVSFFVPAGGAIACWVMRLNWVMVQ